MKKAQSTDQQVDVSTNVKCYKQAVDKLSASISACVGTDLLSEEADIVVDARELEKTMKAKLRERINNAEQMLLAAVATAERTRECAPLAACLETLLGDEVLRQSCADAVETTEKLLATLQEENRQVVCASE